MKDLTGNLALDHDEFPRPQTTLEAALLKVPTVVFYPGRRSGQFGLHFLGFYPEDGNYRATLIGGLP